MTRRPLCNIYVASCEADGGVYEYALFDNGDSEQVRKIPCPSPMYLAKEDGKLYALLRAPFENSSDSGVAVFDEKSGEALGKVLSTEGEVGCHITTHNGDVYCANYIGGSVCKIGAAKVTHKGEGPDKKRQTSPHPHSVLISPDCKYLFTADLGTDTVYVYTRELDLLTSASVPKGSGARHLCFSPSGEYLYCVGEMGGNITVFSWNGGTLTPIYTLDLLKNGGASGSAAAIKLSSDGRFVYVTERRECEIITLATDGDGLTEISRVSSEGKEPRDIIEAAGGRLLICADQWSDSVSVFTLKDGIPTYSSSFSLPSPIALIEK